MAYEVVRAERCDADLEIVFDFLVRSYTEIGEHPTEALERAVARLREIEDDLARLGDAPHQGTLWSELRPGLRWVTKRREIFYFDTDDAAACVRVLAVFYGGQDHRRAVLDRLRGAS